jgi:hypothetical protein
MASTNNALNNTSLNPSGVTGNVQTFTVSNTDDSGASSAEFKIQVGGSVTTGDAGIRHTISGSTIWSTGIDNSVNDQFVTCSSNTLGTSNQHTITTGGINDWVNQPAKIQIPSGNANNITGNGTVFTVTAYSSILNQGAAGGGFSGGVFTLTAGTAVPVMLNGSITLTGCTVNSGIEVRLVTSNRTYSKTINRPASADNNVASISAICDMDAADTARMNIVGTGEAAATDDLLGSTSTAATFFTVYVMG